MDDNGNILISDFGVSTQLEDPEKYMIRGTEGTRHFCSPECLGTTGDVEYSGRASDIWSLGVCLYVYIYLKLPFNVDINDLNDPEGKKLENEGALTMLFALITEAKLKWHPEREVSPELKDLVLKFLDPNFRKRITIDQIKSHPFMIGKKLGED